MRKSKIVTLLAGVSLGMVATAVAAQEAPAAPAATDDAAVDAGVEIVVTARRQSESLQNVPATVNAITATALQKQNIHQFTDIQTVVPSLALFQTGNSFTDSVTMRGLSFNQLTSSFPSVALYLNEAPMAQDIIFSSLYDVGQIEVLSGPQGTTRGQSAPSGSITVATRRANTQEIGGFVDTTVTARDGLTIQGALNLPVIRDVLAVRVAGTYDRSKGDGITSINSQLEPERRTKSIRASVTFTPTDWFQAHLMYQHNDDFNRFFVPVVGGGAGYNGPVIVPGVRTAVGENPNTTERPIDFGTAQFDITALGHRLSYVAGFYKAPGHFMNVQDPGNVLVPGEGYQVYDAGGSPAWSHEVRLASVPRAGKIFDYVVGAFYSLGKSSSKIVQPASGLPGAFGSPLGPDSPFTYNPRFVLPIQIDVSGRFMEFSYFGSVTAHLGKFEFTAGARRTHLERNGGNSKFVGTLQNAYIALPFDAGTCGFLGGAYAATYAGVCDVPTQNLGITPSTVFNNVSAVSKYNAWLYNATASYHVTPDLMVYANTGTAFRGGTGNSQLGNPENDPNLQSLIFGTSEKSRSYEVGAKWTFMQGRGRLNVAAYRQKFNGLIYQTALVPYVESILVNGAYTRNVKNDRFSGNAPAIVKGIDLDVAFKVSSRLTMTGGFSYADAKFDNALVPCRDGNFDGTPDTLNPTVQDFLDNGTRLATCRSSSSLSKEPKWRLSASAEYVVPLDDKVNLFTRALVNYQPSNAFRSPGYTIEAYSLVNLFAGFRSEDGAWEFSVYAKNAFDTDKVISRETAPITSSVAGSTSFANSGYYQVNYTQPREFGLNLRYAFGSR